MTKLNFKKMLFLHCDFDRSSVTVFKQVLLYWNLSYEYNFTLHDTPDGQSGAYWVVQKKKKKSEYVNPTNPTQQKKIKNMIKFWSEQLCILWTGNWKLSFFVFLNHFWFSTIFWRDAKGIKLPPLTVETISCGVL